jgi:hypothetical protein
MSDRTLDARSDRDGAAVSTGTRVRVTVRRRRRARKQRPDALEPERWLAGAKSRRLRLFTLGSSVVVFLMIAIYLMFRS